jgi:hypothetical protein
MDVVPIWLWHTPGAHEDLQLELGDFRHRCCSCNLLLDDTPTHQTDAFGALARFPQLWLDEFDKLCQRPGETFLPFDFDDQGSCWLRVYSGDNIEATVVAGERSFRALLEGVGVRRVRPPGLTLGRNRLTATSTMSSERSSRTATHSTQGRAARALFFRRPAGGGSVWLRVCVGDANETTHAL